MLNVLPGRWRSMVVGIPMLAFMIALSGLAAIGIHVTGNNGPSSLGTVCGPLELSSPPGLGGQQIKRQDGYWVVQGESRSGRAVALMESEGRLPLGCGRMLELSNIRIAAGYKASVFLRTADGEFQQAPIWPQLIGSPTLDLAAEFEGKLADATALGIAVEPIDQAGSRGSLEPSVFRVGQLRIHRSSFGAQLGAMLTSWFEAVAWTGTSIHVVEHQIDTTPGYLRLNFMAGAALAIAFLAALLLFHARPRVMLVAVAIPALSASALLDARWQHRLFHQSQETRALYQDSNERNQLADPEDRELLAVSTMVSRHVQAEGPRVYISTGSEFGQRRLYYHLLPIRAVWKRPSRTFPPYEEYQGSFVGDYIVLTRGSPVHLSPEGRLYRANYPMDIPVQLIDRVGDAILLKIVHPKGER